MRTLLTKNFFHNFPKWKWKSHSSISHTKYYTALAGKAYTIAERPVKTYIPDITKCLLDGKSIKKITAMLISNNTEIYWFKN